MQNKGFYVLAILLDLIKDKLFEWAASHQAAFDKIKQIIAHETILYY